MNYKVIKYFTDLEDGSHPYEAGDIYPRDGLSVRPERVEELKGSDNRQKQPLIIPMEDEKKSGGQETEGEKAGARTKRSSTKTGTKKAE